MISGSIGQDDQVATSRLAGQPALAEVRAVWQGVHIPREEVSVQGKRCVVMAGIARQNGSGSLGGSGRGGGRVPPGRPRPHLIRPA